MSWSDLFVAPFFDVSGMMSRYRYPLPLPPDLLFAGLYIGRPFPRVLAFFTIKLSNIFVGSFCHCFIDVWPTDVTFSAWPTVADWPEAPFCLWPLPPQACASGSHLWPNYQGGYVRINGWHWHRHDKKDYQNWKPTSRGPLWSIPTATLVRMIACAFLGCFRLLWAFTFVAFAHDDEVV